MCNATIIAQRVRSAKNTNIKSLQCSNKTTLMEDISVCPVSLL